MISIIICSKKDKIDEVLNKNIADTINVPYEIVLIDNSDNKYSIFSAYNEGIKRAKYPYLCFIHEDIIFRNDNWGKLLCDAFESDETIGMIGVIGSAVLFDIVYGWWDTSAHVGHILQNVRNAKMTADYKKCSDPKAILTDAVACDGLFLAFPKNIFNKIQFDTNTFTGFHCYDLDISMQVINAGYKIKVINNILIEHFSTGNVTKEFINTCFRFSKKWQEILPVSVESISKQELTDLRDRYILNLLNYKLEYNNSIIDLSKNNTWKLIYKILSPLIKLKMRLRKNNPSMIK